MKYADKIGARYTVVLGDEELAAKKARLKNMTDGTQQEIDLQDFTDAFQSVVLQDAVSDFGLPDATEADLRRILGGQTDGND